MAIDLECGICGQEHRFREEHAGRQTRCKECSARIDIPRGGLGGILDGTTPVFTPPVILAGVMILGTASLIAAWEVAGLMRSSPARSQTAATTPIPSRLPSSMNVAPSRPSLPTAIQPAPPSVPPVAIGRPATTPFNSGSVPAASPSSRRPASMQELEQIRKTYEVFGNPLVSFATADNQPMQIQNISPTWAEPGQPVTLQGKGLAATQRVLAIASSQCREYELTIHSVSDTEIVVSAPPECERRNENVFVFEVYAPTGVAMTLPRELAEAGPKVPIVSDFAIIRRERISLALSSFVLLDEMGSIQTVNSARIYLLNSSQPQSFQGVFTRIIRTERSSISQLSGPQLDAVTVAAIYPCYLEKMFVGPDCPLRRLQLP